LMAINATTYTCFQIGTRGCGFKHLLIVIINIYQ